VDRREVYQTLSFKKYKVKIDFLIFQTRQTGGNAEYLLLRKPERRKASNIFIRNLQITGGEETSHGP
jgi:hypothetical protein